MKVSAIQGNRNKFHPQILPQQKCISSQSNSSVKNRVYNTGYCSISFGNYIPNTKRYSDAKDYLASDLSSVQASVKYRPINLYDFDLDKLDGIQDGIKVFEGMSLKEVAFLLATLSEVATNRGCYNNCSHCYADARPPHLTKDNQINKINWDDFVNLTRGIKELNTRLGFNARAISGARINYITPFHDSDCIDLSIIDKYGLEHDFIDISEKLYEALETPVIFDTAGWAPKNTKLQQRAEKIVDYLKNLDNSDKIYQINLSFNPFHALNTKSVMFRKIGENVSADKLQDLYTTRMANVLYTFTPLLDNKNDKLTLLARAIDNDIPNFEGFQAEDLDEIFAQTLKKLKKMYEKDLNGQQKYVENKKQIIGNLHKYKKLYKDSKSTKVSFTERAIRNFGSDNPIAEKYSKIVNEANKYIDNTLLFDYLNSDIVGLIDSNGKYYLTTYVFTVPTELQLNFKNKDKQTADIKPNMLSNHVITKDLINGDLL